MTIEPVSSIEINGIIYVPQSTANTSPSGNRNIVVVDRGWIFAGDVVFNDTTQELVLSNAVWLFKWESIGFDGAIKNPKSDQVTIRKMDNPVAIPKQSVVFKVPVSSCWGL
jgi:hypothetical protein